MSGVVGDMPTVYTSVFVFPQGVQWKRPCWQVEKFGFPRLLRPESSHDGSWELVAREPPTRLIFADFDEALRALASGGGTRCRRCGSCCQVIGLAPGMTPAGIRRGNYLDAAFVLQHWHRIPRRRAVALAPWMEQRDKGTVFYRCDLLTSAGLCSAHGGRPWVCAAYPEYGDAEFKDPSLPPGCGYWRRPE